MTKLSERLPGVAILALLAVLGNVLSAPLAFRVDFIFGSVFALLALRIYGLWAGVLVAAIAGSYTYILWGHPYALIIFTLEVLVVGVIVQRWFKNLVIADILYWLIFGIGLIWLFYGKVIGLHWEGMQIVLLKQPINGINNAIFATAILALISTSGLSRYLPRSVQITGITIREITFILLLFISYISIVSVMVYNNSVDLKYKLEDLNNHLYEEMRYIERTVKLLDQPDSNQLIVIYNEDNSTEGHLVFLYDDNYQLVAKNKNEVTFQPEQSGTVEAVTGDLKLWLPLRDGMAKMKWLQQGMYFIESDLALSDASRIRISQPSTIVIDSMYQTQVNSMVVLIVFSLLATFLSYYISTLFSKPIQELSKATRNLPQKIRFMEEVNWPKSNIVELDHLSKNSAEMSLSLRQYFEQLLETQATLEQRVKERTASLKESSARNRAIIENSVVGMISMNEQGIVEDFNDAAENIFLYSAREVIGNNVKMLMPEPYSIEHDGYLQHYLLTGEKRIIGSGREVKGLRKDGKLIDIELSVSEVPIERGRLFIGIVSDISQRKQAENIKNEFIANISHELRTPLTAIRGAIGILASGALGELPERGKNMLDITVDNSERLIRLINDLLDLQKLETGSDNFLMQDLQVMPVIEQCLLQNEPYVMEFDCSIFVSGDLGKTRSHINADKLNQVMTNLISNAAKFSPKGGVIAVQLDSDDTTIHISISDQGEGVPRDLWDAMFDKFAQLEIQNNQKVRGTGLGLSISRALMQRMKGTIQVVSIQGRGTTFIVSLPVVNDNAL